MKYFKLLLPFILAILLTVLIPSLNVFSENWTHILGLINKGGLLIYYLRLQNNGTPLINALTIILLSMLAGEYLFNNETMIGPYAFIVANIAFIVVFSLRQKFKTRKDKNSILKVAAVTIYGFGNIIYVSGIMDMAPLIIGNLFLTSVYFYDRLMKLEVVN